MSKTKLEFAELHNPLFFAGKNHGTKLQPEKLSGLSIWYDTEERWIVVEWNGKAAAIPSSNIASMTPYEPADIGSGLKPKKEKVITHVSQPMKANISKTAQVSDPVRDAVQGISKQ